MPDIVGEDGQLFVNAEVKWCSSHKGGTVAHPGGTADDTAVVFRTRANGTKSSDTNWSRGRYPSLYPACRVLSEDRASLSYSGWRLSIRPAGRSAPEHPRRQQGQRHEHQAHGLRSWHRVALA